MYVVWAGKRRINDSAKRWGRAVHVAWMCWDLRSPVRKPKENNPEASVA
jgi:hypothetical protein